MEPTLLPVKPGTLSPEDKNALRNAGIIVIEHENPAELKLMKPTAEIDGSEILRCAMKALISYTGGIADGQRVEFTNQLAKAIISNAAGDSV